MDAPILRLHQPERRTPWAKHTWLGGGLAVSTLIVISLGSGHGAHAQPVDLRTVTIRVAPDESYRAQENWETTLRSTVRVVSDIYEKNFQVRFVILDIVPFTAGPSVAPERLIHKMVADVPVGPADLLVGFSGRRCERLSYGWARSFDRFAMVMTGCYETIILKDSAPESVLSHELAHLFGAFHPSITVDSIMRGGPPDRFDDQTIRVIRLLRNYDFQRGVMGLDQDTRRAWSVIYAEGHARNEPNPLAAALANAGQDLLRSGRMAEGEAALHEAIKIDPSHAGPHTVLGFLYSWRGALEDAARELRSAKALDFRQVEARTELGFVLLRLGKDDEALEELREVLRVDPRLARAHVLLGMTLARRDRVDEAIGEYSEAIRLEPKDASAFENRAIAFGRKGELDRAIQDYDDVIRLNPSHAVAFNNRGNAFRRKGEYDRAIQDFDQAIRLQPTFAGGWNNRCFTRAIVGRLEAALADCNESLRLRPDSIPTLDSRGLTYLKLEQLDEAIADYDAALRLDPRHPHALYGRGLAKRKKGDLPGAEVDLAAARAISPRIAEEYARYGVRP